MNRATLARLASRLLLLATLLPIARALPAQAVDVAPLPAPRDSHGAAIAGGHLHALGGAQNTEWRPTESVVSARIAADGTLGKWFENTPLPARILYIGNGVATLGNMVYVCGGQVRSDTDAGNTGVKLARPRAAYASVGTDGRFAAWRETPDWPSTATYSLAASVTPNALYVSGGADPNDVVSPRVFVAPLDGDGAPGDWVETSPLPRPLWFHGMVHHRGRLIALCGRSTAAENSLNDAIFVAAIQPDHTVGPWSSFAAPFAGRSRAAVAATGAFLFVAGGSDFAGVPIDQLLFAPLGPSAIGEWQAVTLPVAAARWAGAASGPLGALFLTGGRQRPAVLVPVDDVLSFPLAVEAGEENGILLPAETPEPVAAAAVAGPADHPCLPTYASVQGSLSRVVVCYAGSVPASVEFVRGLCRSPEAPQPRVVYCAHDLDSDPAFARTRRVYQVPTFLLLSADGRELGRSVQPRESLRAFVDRSLGM